MARHIQYCPSCKRYTMENTCSACGKSSLLARPPKYSPEDKYGAYRRRAKEMMGKEQPAEQ